VNVKFVVDAIHDVIAVCVSTNVQVVPSFEPAILKSTGARLLNEEELYIVYEDKVTLTGN
jgi:hypothetical protein